MGGRLQELEAWIHRNIHDGIGHAIRDWCRGGHGGFFPAAREVLFFIQFAVDAAGNPGGDRPTHSMACAAHQDDQDNLGINLIRERDKPANPGTCVRARSGLA